MTNKISGDIKMLKELVKLANHLDSIGHRDLSDDLDSVIRKMAQQADLGARPDIPRRPREQDLRELEKKQMAATYKADEILENIERSMYGEQMKRLFLGSPTGAKLSGKEASSFDDVAALRWQLERLTSGLDVANLPFEKDLLEKDLKELEDLIKKVKEEERTIGEEALEISRMFAEQSMPQETDSESDTMAARGDMPDESEGVIRNNEDIMAIERIIGTQVTGMYPFHKAAYYSLKKFLEANADKLSHSEHSQEDYVQTILDTGPEGFSVIGGSHGMIKGRTFRDWRNLIEDLQMAEAPSNEDELDQQNNIEDQEAKIEAMTKALDKLFKY